MRRLGCALAAFALVTTLSACGGKGASEARGPKLTLRQQIGQHFVYPFAGTTPPKALVRRIARGEAAGVILFGRNVKTIAQVRRTTRAIQAIRRPKGLDAPLLVMIDQEGGVVRRLPGAPAKSAAKMGVAAGAQGAATAKLLRSAGVNVDLAPVVDVARPGGAIDREERGFGSSAASVTKLAGAFSKGLSDGGVAPVLKHFPGFGAAARNTDEAPVEIDLSIEQMRATDLVPFQRIRAPAVLLSTAVYPKIDPAPAAFSKKWATDELRTDLGFNGVAITDDLQTPAVDGFGTPAQLAYFAISSGADIALFAKTYGTAAQAASGLTAAVRGGRLSRAQLEVGARRVLALRASLR